MTATDMDARGSRFVMLAVGVLIASQQVVAPARLRADDADQKQQIDALIAQLKDPDPKARKSAASALYKMAKGENPPRQALADAAVPLLMAYTEQRERVWSWKAVLAIGAPAVQKLTPLLRHEKREVRRSVCSAIRSMARHDPVAHKAMIDAMGPLVAALGDEDRSVASSASMALSEIGPPAIKPLISALRHKEMKVRIGAARALANIAQKPGTPPSATAGAIAPLTAMTKESDIQARANAYRALATVDSRRRVEILLEAFDDGDPRLRQFAVHFIANHSRGPWAKQLADKRLIAHMTAAVAADAAMRRREEREASAGRTSGADLYAAHILHQHVERLNFARTPLKDALQFIREYSNTNILVDWRALAKIGVASFSAVTVTARDVSVSEALRLILADVAKGKTPLRFEVISGVVVISTPEDLLAIQKTRQVEKALRRAAGAADQAVWKKLDGAIPKIDFNRVPLKDAISFLRDVSGVSIVLDWKALEGLGVRETSSITIKLRGPTVATTLWVILLNAGDTRDLAIRVKNGAVTMSMAAATARRPSPVTPRPTPPKTPKAPPSDDMAAARMLRLATLYRNNKNTDKAVGLYRQIVKRYPKTKAADVARKYLAEIDGR